MPMGIGPGLSVTRFESGIPGWMTGMDLGWDWVSNSKYNGAVDPTDTHSAAINAQFAAGGWSPFAANTLVRTDLGLQTVPTRTNSIRNNSNVGAVPGSPGTPPTNWTASAQTGYAWQLVGTGTEFGLPYIDYRLSGTDALLRANNIIFETGTGIVAATGNTWTLSAFARVVAGSLTGVTTTLQMDENTSVGGFVANGNTTITTTSAMARYSFTRTLSGGATVARVQPFMRFTTGAGATVDVTIRVYAPQMELGAFASAPILTTSGAATVNGNQQVVDLTGRLGSGVGGILQINTPAIVDAGAPIAFNNGSGLAEALRLVYTGGILQWQTRTGGGSYIPLDVATASASTVTIAFASSANFLQARVVGQSQPTAVTTEAFPSGLSRFNIGGIGLNAGNNTYQLTRRAALRFGTQNASTFADLFAKATILNAVS